MMLSTLLNGLWQGAPIVAIAYLLSRTVSRQNATTRYALWFTTLVALVVVPILATVSNAGAQSWSTPTRGLRERPPGFWLRGWPALR
jgi:hypothetical protein